MQGVQRPDSSARSSDRVGHWLRGLGRKAFGDVIVASTGDDARGVAVGKYIIQIGTLVVSTRLVLLVALLLLLASATPALLALLVAPTRMDGQLNVAIAEFGQLDEHGEGQPSDHGRRLSQWIFRNLREEYQHVAGTPSTTGFRILVWHDSMDPKDKRARIGLVRGRTEAERADHAAAIARGIKAHILVYGNLSVAGTAAGFSPEFYVADDYEEADWIKGRHRLGSNIPVELPIDLDKPLHGGGLSPEMTARTLVLSRFTIGLFWDLLGKHAAALEMFESAERQWGNADAERGKELVYLFIGREAHLLGRDERALQAYQQALDRNRSYSRAHVGLGNIYYDRAQTLVTQDHPPADDLTRALESLDPAIRAYEVALRHAADSPGAQVDVKARLGLGNAHCIRGVAYLRLGQHPAADASFDAAIAEVAEALAAAGAGDHRHAALGFLGLGNAYQRKAYIRLVSGDRAAARPLLDGADSAYARCLEHADAQPVDWLLRKLKSDYCTPYRESAQASLRELEAGGL